VGLGELDEQATLASSAEEQSTHRMRGLYAANETCRDPSMPLHERCFPR
jgi:hypothetical protein